jgi:hypothetical protein
MYSLISNWLRRFRKAGYQAIDRICDYYSSLESRPVVSDVEPGYLRRALPGEHLDSAIIGTMVINPFAAEAPERGEDFDVIADDYQRLILPGMPIRLCHESVQRSIADFVFFLALTRTHTLATPCIFRLFSHSMYL